jgi:hypothetical protein
MNLAKHPAKIVPLMWLVNAIALVAGVFGLMQVHADAQNALKESATAAAPSERIRWKDSVEHTDHGSFETRLSPIERPVVDLPPDNDDPPPPPHEKTDAELQAELELALNQTFTLLRIFYGEGAELANSATLAAGGLKLHLFKGSNLKQMLQNSRNQNARALALDITVLSIGSDHIVLDAPSFEKPDKRFEVRLEFRGETVAR